MGSDQVPTEPLITLCAESTRTQPSRVQEASEQSQSVKRALVISRPDGIGRSTASSSARARSETTKRRNSKSLTSTISIRSNHNVGQSQEAMNLTANLYAVILLDEQLLVRYLFL